MDDINMYSPKKIRNIEYFLCIQKVGKSLEVVCLFAML